MTGFNGENANCGFNSESSVKEESRVNDANSKFKELKVLIPFYNANKYIVTFAHININSVRHTFDALA